MLCHCHGQGLYDPREICEQYVQCRKLENARQPLGGSFEKRSHIEKRDSTCFLSFLQLAPPSSAAPCDKVCSGKSGKRNRWLLPPSNPTMVSPPGSVSPRIIGSTALSDQSYLLWLPYSSTREHLKPFYSFTNKGQ